MPRGVMSCRQRHTALNNNVAEPDTSIDRLYKHEVLARSFSSSSLVSTAPDFKRKCILWVITFVLIGGTFFYLFTHEPHIDCYHPSYTPFNGTVCYSEEPKSNRYELFGTKTNYNVTIQKYVDGISRPFDVPGCQMVLFYLFQRHTTRYPDKKDIVEAGVSLKALQEKILVRKNIQLCKKDLDTLSHWIFPFVPDQDNMIAPEGSRITKEQVGRLIKRFPTIFDPLRPFDGNSIIVDFTPRRRSQETAYNFMQTWFTEDTFKGIIEPLIQNNFNEPLLQFHKNCSDMLKKRGKQVKTPKAVLDLESSTHFSRLLETLSSRLGFEVTKDETRVMYKQCAYELAILGESPWCAMFTPEDLKLLEFREDLDDYFKDAYGNDVNWRQACPVAEDLFDNIDQVTAPAYVAKFTRTVLHFSHAGALKKILAYFGIGRGSTANWTCKHRDWRSSNFCPFNANILFTLYQCSDEQPKIATMLNEKLIQLPGCSSKLCPLSEFRKAFQPKECSLSKICS